MCQSFDEIIWLLGESVSPYICVRRVCVCVYVQADAQDRNGQLSQAINSWDVNQSLRWTSSTFSHHMINRHQVNGTLCNHFWNHFDYTWLKVFFHIYAVPHIQFPQFTNWPANALQRTSLRSKKSIVRKDLRPPSKPNVSIEIGANAIFLFARLKQWQR